MSGDNYKFQASLKFGPGGIGMLNIRADSKEELEQSLTEALSTIGSTAVLVDAYNTEFQGVSGPPQQSAPASQASGMLCVHGAMVRREGTNAKGKWAGWFCPTPKGTPGQCPAKFDR